MPESAGTQEPPAGASDDAASAQAGSAKVTEKPAESQTTKPRFATSPSSPRAKRDRVVVRVPATSANLGPGFDCLGMAIDIWNEITVERASEFSIQVEGEGASMIPTDAIPGSGAPENLVVKAMRKAFTHAGEVPMPPVKVITRNIVPVCSGFGSSSAAIVGGLIAGLVLAGKELRVRGADGVDPEELLQLATEMEGHPDNVAPAIYGGIQLSIVFDEQMDAGRKQLAMSRRVPFPAGMRLVAYVPGEAARLGTGADKTEEMRNLLKPHVPRSDAVFNIQRVALLIDALHRGDLEALQSATKDRMHQPIRGEKAYPHINAMMQAATDAGAHGSFLSGAGPTVIAICSGASGDIFTQKRDERQETVVAEAMRRALDSLPSEVSKAWGGGQFYIVSPSNRGAHVVTAEPKFSDSLATFGSLDGPM